MSDVIELIHRLDAKSRELGQFADDLAKVERDLEPVQLSYEKFISDFEVGLYHQSLEEGGPKLPSERLRIQLAHQKIDADLYGRFLRLTSSRERLEKRIKTMQREIDALRSILSAEKELAR